MPVENSDLSYNASSNQILYELEYKRGSRKKNLYLLFWTRQTEWLFFTVAAYKSNICVPYKFSILLYVKFHLEQVWLPHTFEFFKHNITL